MKKLLAFFMTLTFVSLTITSTLFAATSVFSDTNGHWAEDDIKTAVEAGWVTGFPDGTYKPDASMTKAEFATALARTFGLSSSDSNFLDVQNHWAYSYISAIKDYVPNYELGNNKLFGPNDVASREYVFVTLVNILRMSDLTQSETNSVLKQFSDQNMISTTLRPKVARAIKEQIVSGYNDSSGALRLNPRGEITRAQIVTLLKKVTYGSVNLYNVSLTVDGDITLINAENPTDKEKFTANINKPKFVIKAKTDPEADAYINNSEVAIDSNGYFSKEIVASGNTMEIPIKVSKLGKTKQVTIDVQINLKAPEIVTNYPDKTANATATISGTISDNSSQDGLKLYIDGEQVSINSNGDFQKDVSLQYGKNTFSIEVLNYVTNKKQKGTISIERTSPPVSDIKILSSLPTTISESSIRVNANAQNAKKVYVGSKEMSLNSDGDFYYDWNLKEGLNEITIAAYDVTGTAIEKTLSITYSPAKQPEPTITFITNIPTITHTQKIILNYRVENATKVYIDSQQVSVDSDGFGSYDWYLENGNNSLSITAVNSSGQSVTKDIETEYISEIVYSVNEVVW